MFKKIKTMVLASLVASSACNYHKEKHPATDSESENASKSGGSAFTFLASNLFHAQCAKCHNPGRSTAGVDLTTYKSVASGQTNSGEALVVSGKPDDSLIVKVIASGKMPPGGGNVDAKLLAALKCWIKEGAPRVGASQCVKGKPQPSKNPAPPPIEPEDALTFADLFTNVIEPNCVGCHSGDEPAENVNLETYEHMMASQGMRGGENNSPMMPVVTAGNKEQSLLWLVVHSNWMPFDSDPISDQAKQMIDRWISEGARNE